MNSRNFIKAIRGAFSGWIGCIYTYDDTGNREIRVWTSETNDKSKEDAIDTAIEHAALNSIEIESIDFE